MESETKMKWPPCKIHCIAFSNKLCKPVLVWLINIPIKSKWLAIARFGSYTDLFGIKHFPEAIRGKYYVTYVTFIQIMSQH